ncbi:ricin-type beta-trefoil lectin domain protein [Streptomyces sp. NPDC001020]
MPRLTQLSSLGSRQNAGRLPAASSAPAPADDSVENGYGDGFKRRGDEGTSPGANIVVPLRPRDRRSGDKARREGFRGALAVVGIVGLLAAGGVLLTLGLGDRHGQKKHEGAPVGVGYDGRHDRDLLDGLSEVTEPSATATASGTKAGKDAKDAEGSAKPTSGSPSSRATSKESATPSEHATAPAKGGSKDTTTHSAVAPGVKVFSHASNRCIDIAGGKAVQGAKLMIWDCSDSASQRWTFTDGSMRALGMCVQLAEASTADGTDLELAHCNGAAAQRFELNWRHDLASSLANKCADVRDNGTANGTRLQLWSCAGSDNQKWSEAGMP